MGGDTGNDLTIHQAIAEVINEVGGIGKTGFNPEQKFHFRGIDVVLQNLHPLFAKYGIFFTPEVIERQYEQRVSKSGTIGHCAHLHVRYTIYGPKGDSITLSTWGEGLDYSDKATNKAMTAAFKYALFQVFAICDPVEDADAESPEGSSDGGDMTVMENLVELLTNCGFTLAIQSDIILAAIGRRIRNLGELSEEEVQLATTAIESAITDRNQLEETP